MKVYIAGAITGKFKYKEDFKRGEERVRYLGHIALNPSFLPEGLEDYFEINKAMIDQCDAIYVLRGYENSVGTQKEIEYAKSKGWSTGGGTIIYESEDIPIKYLGESCASNAPFMRLSGRTMPDVSGGWNWLNRPI